MSVQNILKKPNFTKTVMGYTVSEVDKYIDHVTERYNSVCAENSELKRRVLRLQLMLDEANAKLSTAEEESSQPKPLDRSALCEVFDVLDAELRRTQAFYEDLKGKLNEISEVKDNGLDDSEWEATLNAFISSVSADEQSEEAILDDETEEMSFTFDAGEADEEDVADEADEIAELPQAPEEIFADFESFVLGEDEEDFSESAGEEKYEPQESYAFDEAEDTLSAEETVIVAEDADEEEVIMNSDSEESDKDDASYEEETEMLLKLLQGTFNVPSEEEKTFDHDLGAEFATDEDEDFDGDFEVVSFDSPEEETEEDEADEESEATEAREKTPAELAAELDFYTDSVIRDGESFDPMTLARQATSRKPKYEDFFHTEPQNKQK